MGKRQDAGHDIFNRKTGTHSGFVAEFTAKIKSLSIFVVYAAEILI